MYWANYCPHNTQSANVLEDDLDKCEVVNIGLMTGRYDKNAIFVVEASKSAAIDTACTKTGAGENCIKILKPTYQTTM